ncbi:coagulation factor VIII [Alosa sapidissima]|uniref:coagulation factor VIII n=1 Tax=Alosa sapidissima TaxID=34773 RepID=UPI001C085B9A|nr:coagulation factor VIII [Alosa sapidissima]
MKRKMLLLFVTLLLGAVGQSWAVTWEYYIAAIETTWNYLDSVSTDVASRQRPDIPKYTKAIYNEYTDSTFTTQKSKPPWAGIQGPTIRAQVSDKVVIHFKNFASQPFSISPIGIPYWKQSEGAGYDDSTTSQEQGDDAVAPGGYYKYVWEIHVLSGPTMTDPDCLTYSYSSRVDIIRDFNSGLIGPLLICRAGVLTVEGKQKVPEFILLFAVFDENKTWYRNLERSLDKFKKPEMAREYHTINGHFNSSLPGLTLCQGYEDVSWHLIGVGTSPEIHSIQFQEYSLQVMKHRKVSLEMAPMTFTTALMKPLAEGTFQISCRIHSHKNAGMTANFTVHKCVDPVLPDKRNVKVEEEDDPSYDDLMSTIVFQRGGVASLLRSGSKGRPRVRVHYIAAEEHTWDYAPNVKKGDRLYSSENLRQGPQRLGKVYKKVAYVEYTDKSFTKRKRQSPGKGLIGPVLTGEVGDKFQIIFKNLANRPYNIYPNGLTSILPLNRKATHKDMSSLAIQPGDTFSYLWKLTSEDGPTDLDPRCLTRLYQSTLNPERDLASGLVGPLIVCKPGSLDRTGRVVTSDIEKHLMFAIFDENKSWYLNENIQNYSEDPNALNTQHPDFYKSNVMNTVNGLMYNNLHFKVCLGEVTFWHMANVGTQSDFLSVYFTGNPFEKNKVYNTVLTLFPMSGETVATEMETLGEWEISAFDPKLKNQGMSAQYSVFSCEKLPTVDTEEDYDFDYVFDPMPMARGARGDQGNQTVAIRVCRPVKTNDTQLDNTLPIEGREGKRKQVCEMKYISVAGEQDTSILSEGGIPEDILAELDKELNGDLAKRRKRSLTKTTEENTDGDTSADQVLDVSDGMPSGFSDYIDLVFQGESQQTAMENSTEADVDETSKEKNKTLNDFFGRILQRLDQGSLNDPIQTLNETWEEADNSVEKDSDRQNRSKLQRRQALDLIKHTEQEGSIDLASENDILDDNSLDSLDGLTEYLDKLQIDLGDLVDLSNSTDNTTDPRQMPSFEYDDYSDEKNFSMNDIPYEGGLNPRSSQPKYRSYYIAAEEVMWDYGITKPHQLIRPKEMRRGYRKYFPAYKKVVFRAYQNKDFLEPVKQGELDEHLGIMGPVLKAEVNDVLTVVFRNKASRPYSLHLQGVYDKFQGQSSPSGIPGQDYRPDEAPGEPVPPGEERVYNWRVHKRQGPATKDFDCKTGAYYSTVDKEKDINSGLIGPLLICNPGTLKTATLMQPGVRDLFLLFTIFDEQKSWYMEENIKKFCSPPCRANKNDPWFEMSNKFSAINGYVAETLPGLAIEQYKTVRWHLMNMGSGGEFHSVYFHGLPFSVRNDEEHRMGVFNLYPGVFGTIEMRPPMLGTWMVECSIGEHQLSGMRAKLLVYDPECIQPLGMESGIISDEQISASDYYDNWEPGLARLQQSGSFNAWVGHSKTSWLQVDLRKPMLIHGLQTQGARTGSLGIKETFTMYFTVSYSMDNEHWKIYRGNDSKPSKVFIGNWDGSSVNENLLSPPIIGQHIRLNPVVFKGRPTFRLELLGCDLNSCLMPLGMQKKTIPNNSITASSYLYKWLLSWTPSLARLHQEGRANAWRPKSNDPHQWIQVDFMEQRRVTGIITQGARSMLQGMMVTEFCVSTSDNGHDWTMVMEGGREKKFEGNMEYDEQKLNLFDPPLFARYIRIFPRGWLNDIALRLEFLGCETQQRL